MTLGQPASTKDLLGNYNVDQVPSLTMQSGATVTGGAFAGGTSTNTMTGIGATVGGVASSSFSQASSTTLNNVTGMSASLAVGTYIIDGYLATTNNGTGGIKLALAASNSLAASLLLTDTWVYNTTTLTAESNNSQTSVTGNLVNSAVAATAVFFGGTIIVTTAGTLTLQAGQNTSNGTALTIANGSYITFTRIA